MRYEKKTLKIAHYFKCYQKTKITRTISSSNVVVMSSEGGIGTCPRFCGDLNENWDPFRLGARFLPSTESLFPMLVAAVKSG